MGVAGAAGMLASTIALYISYHPYAALYSRFAQAHGSAESDAMMSFWGFVELPWMMQGIFSGAFSWFALLFIAACLLVFEVYRFFAARGPAHQAV